MLKTNIDQLVKISVLGEIANPTMPGLPASPYLVSAGGEPMLVPSFGSIVYNIQLGDRALGWAAELIQPGVSIKAGENANTALGVYSCLGNKARVMNGAASGATGFVTGKADGLRSMSFAISKVKRWEKWRQVTKCKSKATGWVCGFWISLKFSLRVVRHS